LGRHQFDEQPSGNLLETLPRCRFNRRLTRLGRAPNGTSWVVQKAAALLNQHNLAVAGQQD
jgi:hypothetical protein